MSTDQFIVQHVRDGHGRPVGTLAAKKIDGLVCIGWSKCQRHEVVIHRQYDEDGKLVGEEISKGDKFDKNEGTKIALNRCHDLHAKMSNSDPLPHSMKKHLKGFVARAYRYYNTLAIAIPPVKN